MRNRAALLLAAGYFIVPACHAFFEWESPSGRELELRGLLRAYVAAADGPSIEGVSTTQDASIAGVVRLLADLRVHENLRIEANAYRAHIPIDVAGANQLVLFRDVERSSALERSLGRNNFSRLALDRLNLRFSRGDWSLIAGRQPVNLATSFFFTPNDFFAPFAAQTFYRVYKPGVDALRADWQAGELSQLSVIGVAGYSPDADADTGWSTSPDSSRNSWLARGSFVRGALEWALLGGRVRRDDVLGAAVQGELFGRIGLRAEGHYARARNEDVRSAAEISLGIERRFENSLDLRAEYFHHGRGAQSVGGYAATSSAGIYRARRYLALGAAYEFSPLFNGQAAAIFNLVDDSFLLALNGVYSLSDNTELALNATLATGDEPNPAPRSEFGSYPDSISIEVRAYF